MEFKMKREKTIKPKKMHQIEAARARRRAKQKAEKKKKEKFASGKSSTDNSKKNRTADGWQRERDCVNSATTHKMDGKSEIKKNLFEIYNKQLNLHNDT